MLKLHAPKPYRRRISPNEKFYLACAEIAPPFCLQLVVEGMGGLVEAALEEAVRVAADANPGCRLLRKGRWWVDSGDAPPIRLLPKEAFDAGRLLTHNSVKRKLDATKGPTCEVLLVLGNSPCVVFRALHAVMDGKGLQFWAEEVFRALRSEPLLGSEATISDREALLASPYRHVRRDRLALNAVASYVLCDRKREGMGHEWARLSMRGSGSALAAKIAAFLSHEGELSSRPDGKVRLMVPVDLRPRLNGLRTTGNMSNPLFLELEKGTKWIEIQEKLLCQLAAQREWGFSIFDGVFGYLPTSLLRLFVRRQFASGRFLLPAILSHIGKVQLSAFSCKGFRAGNACFLPVDVPGVPLMIVSVETDVGIELTFSMPENAQNNDVLRHLSGRLRAVLESGQESVVIKSRGQDWNNTLADYPHNITLYDLFAEQAKTYPLRTAISVGDKTLLYGELLAQSRHMALRLVARGVTRGQPVVVRLNHSFITHVVLFGIMRAGGAFVPVDPDCPDERFQRIVKDSGARLLVTVSLLPMVSVDGVEVIYADQDEDVEPPSVLPPRPESADIAYIMYTSGSTGVPKGVVVCHRSIVNYICWAKNVYLNDDGQTAVFSLLTSLAFDLTLTSVFLPLIAGGSIRLYPAQSPIVAMQKCCQEGIVNCLKLTPSHLKIINELGMNLAHIVCIIVGGEDFSTGLAASIDRLCGGTARLFNEYGPTEATVGCMIHEYAPERDKNVSVPIGRPAANVQIHLLDDALRPVVCGEKGEIYISGDCLAEGYYRQALLTQERFLPNPFDLARKIYRTGDLAVYSSDGVLHYCGRSDRQIKLRGHRIELAEIENALLAVDGATNSAAIGIGKGGNVEGIAVFMVARAFFEPGVVSQILKDKLPQFMLPEEVYLVPEIPLTTNGKVDEAKLNLWRETKRCSDPITQPLESTLARRVLVKTAEIIGVPSSSIDEETSLFDQGLDSLGFVNLVSWLNQEILPREKQGAFLERLDEFIKRPSIANLVDLVHGS